MRIQLSVTLGLAILGAALLSLPGLGAPSEPAASSVSEVRFAGTLHVPETSLRAALALKPGANFTPKQLEQDRKALLALGWFRSVTASPETDGSKTTVTFRLVEWPKVTHIRVLGNTVLDRAAIMSAISTRVGQILRPSILREDIAAIERLYRERGFVGQVSENLLGEAAESGILRFEVLEVAIADVKLEGASAALRGQARAELRETPPQLYRPEALVDDQRRLLKLRGVKDATARVETVEPGRIRVIWRLNLPPIEPTMPMPAPANPRPEVMGQQPSAKPAPTP